MSPSKLVNELTGAGVAFSLQERDGKVKLMRSQPWDPGQEPAEVKALLDKFARQWHVVQTYLLRAVPIGEVTSLHGERLRVYQARPICVLGSTCWRMMIGCNLYPDTSEHGWAKRCRERVSGRATNRQARSGSGCNEAR